ncbi:MAG: hypothetical protein GX455_13990 [Phycisphaerae bacterium]|nr:hypothetical protein [Phycisphaerae bacterium]
MAMMAFAALFDETEDGFGKDIVVPKDMVMEEPINAVHAKEEIYKIVELKTTTISIDPEGKMLIDLLLDKNNSGSLEIDTDLPILSRFVNENRDKLIQHLKTTPHWRIVQGDKIYAIRRFAANDKYFDTLNGYYGNYCLVDSFEHWGEDLYFQFRVILSLDGEVMSKPWAKDYSKFDVSSGVRKLKTKSSINKGIESYLVLCSDGITLEIMEDTKQKGRVFTQAVCKLIADELQTVLDSETMTIADFEQKMVGAGRATKGKADIWIENGMQGGMYNVYANINPKEPGYVYLKIFEATKNTPLSADSVKLKSRKVIEFSEDDDLQFLYESSIMIYEGDWGVYYPARFELWFVPDSGQEEREILEQIFKIEGWMR